MAEPSWEVVAVYDAPIEAEIAAGRLKSVGILCRIDQRDTVGHFGPGQNWRSVHGVALLVPGSLLEEARAALDIE